MHPQVFAACYDFVGRAPWPAAGPPAGFFPMQGDEGVGRGPGGPPHERYSQRSARIGSTIVARRAGTYPASNAIAVIPSVAITMVRRSFGLMP